MRDLHPSPLNDDAVDAVSRYVRTLQGAKQRSGACVALRGFVRQPAPTVSLAVVERCSGRHVTHVSAPDLPFAARISSSMDRPIQSAGYDHKRR